MNDKVTNINLRSEMAKEVISSRPGNIERWSLAIFAVIVISLISALWFVKYPDTIEARASLTAANAPKEIIPRREGRLIKLFFHNNSFVNKGEVIGWIESTANHSDIIDLSCRVDSAIGLLTNGNQQDAAILFSKRFENLGETQNVYQQFVTAWQLFNDYMVNGYYAHKRSMLKSDIKALASSRQNILYQKDLALKDLELAGETFGMNTRLFEEKIISREEMRIEKSKLLGKQKTIPQLDAVLFSNETLQRDKQKEINQLEHEFSIQKITFLQALQSLKSTVDEWKRNYLLMSPVSGRLFFTVPLQEDQMLLPGKLMGFIIPEDSRIYVEAILPQANSGKLDTGLKVQLRFDAYPYQEFGFVDGTLSYISGIPSDSGFLANVRLNKGLTTSNSQPILYKSGLKAQAIIITKDMRLLERLYANAVKSVTNGNK